MTQSTDASASDTILEHLRKTLVDMFNVDPGSIQGSTRLIEDLELDSIDAIDLIVSLQEHTGQQVDQEKFEALRTVDDVVRLLADDLQDSPP